jgi:hypothetical protein
MTEIFQCGDNAALVSYLHEECDPADHAAISTHVSLCVACEAELAALQSARVHLAEWMPPEAELGFRVVFPGVEPRGDRSGAPMSSGSWWREPLPAWAQAAAACLLFAAGLWLGVERGSAPGASSTVPVSGIVDEAGIRPWLLATGLSALRLSAVRLPTLRLPAARRLPRRRRSLPSFRVPSWRHLNVGSALN